MGIVTGIVLFAIIWFLVLLIALQVGVTSQDEAGERVAGTHGSAPANAELKKRAVWTSAISLAVWIVIASVIHFDVITIDDIDLFTRFGMGSSAD